MVQIDAETEVVTEIFVSMGESALCLSLDAEYLTVGTNSKVILLKKDEVSGHFEKVKEVGTSDNVSCVRVVEEGMGCVFGTYDGRVGYWAL